MGLAFEWDEQKARENVSKHGVSFREAYSVFGDVLSLTIDDLSHSTGETRLITAGLSNLGRFLVVVHTQRGDNIRIISARRATPQERRVYEQGSRQS